MPDSPLVSLADIETARGVVSRVAATATASAMSTAAVASARDGLEFGIGKLAVARRRLGARA